MAHTKVPRLRDGDAVFPCMGVLRSQAFNSKTRVLTRRSSAIAE